MNNQEFTNYIVENFECSTEAASAIIEVFSESIYLAISEGYEINLDNLGKFAIKTSIHKKTPYFTPAQNLKIACT